MSVRAGLSARVAAAAVLVSACALAAPPKWRPPPPGRVTKAQKDAQKRWHEPTPIAAPKDDAGRPQLMLWSLNTDERARLSARGDEGGWSAQALETAAHLLRDQRTGQEHPVDPALLDLIYLAQRHFESGEVRIVSGYRAPSGKGASNHGRGRAMDIVLAGVTDEALSAWARGLGFTGVGVYPTSGFCHLDVRTRSHFWVDRSGPGQRSREQAVPGASKADEEAKKRGRKPFPGFVLPASDVDAVWSRGAHHDEGDPGAGSEHEGD